LASHFREAPILLQKAAATDCGWLAVVKIRDFDVLAPDSSPTLRNAQNLSRWRPCHQGCKPTQVLSNGCKNKLVLGAAWATQSQSPESQDALQVREPHLDLLALAL
jgi:hypothetical protein